MGGGETGVRLQPGGGAGQRGQHRGEQPRGEPGEYIYTYIENIFTIHENIYTYMKISIHT